MHCSLYLCTGPGVAALACAGPATANLRLGQLHILPSCATANRTYSTISASELSTYSSGNDPIGLALSLADQQVRSGGALGPAQQEADGESGNTVERVPAIPVCHALPMGPLCIRQSPPPLSPHLLGACVAIRWGAV